VYLKTLWLSIKAGSPRSKKKKLGLLATYIDSVSPVGGVVASRVFLQRSHHPKGSEFLDHPKNKRKYRIYGLAHTGCQTKMNFQEHPNNKLNNSLFAMQIPPRRNAYLVQKQGMRKEERASPTI